MRYIRQRSFWIRLLVNASATLLVVAALFFDRPLQLTEALAAGALAAFIGTVVMEYG